MAREPGYCRHKASGQAYVNLQGRIVYLGEWGTEKSKERYRAIKAEWLSNQAAFDAKQEAKRARTEWPTMGALCCAHYEFAQQYYGHTVETDNFRKAYQPISDLYAHRATDLFCPVSYRACRDWWLQDKKRSRQYVNKMAKYLLRVLRWGVSERMVPPATYEAARCVMPLKRGKTTAPESKAITPVDDATVNATLEHCTPILGDMIKLQRFLGARPGELVALKPSMVRRDGPIWIVDLLDHKTAHHGIERRLYVGPRGQAILARYLLRDSNAHCFSPAESEAQRLEAKHAGRVTPLSCGNKPGSNRKAAPKKTPGDAFTVASYRRAIRYACIKAKITPWSPNQLRHSSATAIRKQFGLEHAQATLGHRHASTTEIYALRDEQKALEVARQIG